MLERGEVSDLCWKDGAEMDEVVAEYAIVVFRAGRTPRQINSTWINSSDNKISWWPTWN